MQEPFKKKQQEKKILEFGINHSAMSRCKDLKTLMNNYWFVFFNLSYNFENKSTLT